MHAIVLALAVASSALYQVPIPAPAPAPMPAPVTLPAVAALPAVPAVPAIAAFPAPVAFASLEALASLEGLGALEALASLEALDAVASPGLRDALEGLGALSRLRDIEPELPPEGWLPQDPADSLWRAARAALDDGDPRRAAELYRRLRTERRFASSSYRSHAYYWEAYARHRIGGASELRSALATLEGLRRTYPQFENMVEVERLQARVNGDLAAAGDAAAASRQAERARRAAAPSAQQCPDQEVRVTVVESLITMSSEQAMPLLKQVMANRNACNAPLREKAVFIISQKRSSEAEDLLLDAARNDPDPKVREQAVFWLSQVNSEKSLVAIEEILRNATDEKLVEQAVFAVSQHRSARAAQILRDIAGRSNAPHEARKNAIFWLGQSRGSDVNTFIRDLYGSLNDQELKEAVLFALSQNSDAGNADFLIEVALNEREPVEMRKSALFWAGQKRALPLNRLGELYRSIDDREMREAIIFTMSQRREPEAVERLIEIARTERDVELRKTAIFWLGQSKDPRAVRFLGELIGS
ncbi:MAG TPA: HEAT repeat domain-containing protein [Longimicrobiales bacterium]|nr:HEAT repeat domain-containing protein [Longimicrobiales bacterium]